jgi:hypothetical protein
MKEVTKISFFGILCKFASNFQKSGNTVLQQPFVKTIIGITNRL